MDSILSAALAHIAKLPAGTRVAIVGSREFDNLQLVREFVAALPASCILVSGGARGVDQCAASAWQERGLSPIVLPFRAEFGRAGGPIRNSKLVNSLPLGSVLVAFRKLGTSPGTDDVVRKAKQAHSISVFVVSPPPTSGPAQLSLF